MSVAVRAPSRIKPAFKWSPGRAPDAKEAAQLAASAGLILDPEQLLILDAVMAQRADGRPVFETCVIEPRQNGKTWALMASVLYDLLVGNDKLIVWSAHEFGTAMRTFKDFKTLINGADFLASRVLREDNANDNKGFEFTNGAELRFKARTKVGGRGLAGDKVILDEAFALGDEHMGALIPIMTTRIGAQVRYASSACHVSSEVLRGLRNRGRAGGDPSLAFIEWCAPQKCAVDDCDHAKDRKGCACDDPKMLRLANPGAVRRRDDWAEHFANERRSLAVDEFCRERMGWHEDPAEDADELDLERWEALGDPGAAPQDPLVLGLDASPLLASATIVAVGASADDPAVPVLEIPTGCHRKGTRWVVKRLVELRAAHGKPDVVIDPGSPAGALIPALMEAGIEPILLTGREVVQACLQLVSLINEGALIHRSNSVMTAAAIGARRRAVSDGFKWTRIDSSSDISPIAAATWAVFHWQSGGDEPFNIW